MIGGELSIILLSKIGYIKTLGSSVSESCVAIVLWGSLENKGAEALNNKATEVLNHVLGACNYALAIGGNIFTTDISQVTERFESQPYQLFVERIQFAHRGNVEQQPTEAADIALKRALRRNEAAEEMGGFRILDFDRFQSLSDCMQ